MPNFHYFNQYTVYKEEHWQAYQRVNQEFAKIVAEDLEDDDTVWIMIINYYYYLK